LLRTGGTIVPASTSHQIKVAISCPSLPNSLKE
jgi:hypothetical protein